jgi:hypothetical protein
MTEVPKKEKYDFSMLPGADVGRYESEIKRKEYDRLFEETTLVTLTTGTAPDNAEVLYALSCAAKHTQEKITPDRLIEMTGLYYPPNSRERVVAALNNLQDMAFVYSEETTRGRIYNLTGMGEILIRFLDEFSRTVIDFGVIKEKLSPDVRKTFGKMSKRQNEVQKELYRRFRRVEERFKKGI